MAAAKPSPSSRSRRTASLPAQHSSRTQSRPAEPRCQRSLLLDVVRDLHLRQRRFGDVGTGLQRGMLRHRGLFCGAGSCVSAICSPLNARKFTRRKKESADLVLSPPDMSFCKKDFRCQAPALGSMSMPDALPGPLCMATSNCLSFGRITSAMIVRLTATLATTLCDSRSCRTIALREERWPMASCTEAMFDKRVCLLEVTREISKELEAKFLSCCNEFGAVRRATELRCMHHIVGSMGGLFIHYEATLVRPAPQHCFISIRIRQQQ